MKDVSNRAAIYISPKEMFKTWAKLYNDSSEEELANRVKEKHIYLIDLNLGQSLKDTIEPYYTKVFENELMLWNVIEHEWPKNRSINVFLDWFEVNISDDVFDLEAGKITTEENDW